VNILLSDNQTYSIINGLINALLCIAKDYDIDGLINHQNHRLIDFLLYLVHDGGIATPRLMEFRIKNIEYKKLDEIRALN
jgi:hypothetical protein